MHLAKNAPDFAFAGKNREKSFPGDASVLERAVYKAQSATDRVAQLGAEIELPDLGMMECANEPVGIIGKGIARFFVKLSSARDEAVEFFDFRTKDPEKPRFFRDRVHPLYHKFRDQMELRAWLYIPS